MSEQATTDAAPAPSVTERTAEWRASGASRLAQAFDADRAAESAQAAARSTPAANDNAPPVPSPAPAKPQPAGPDVYERAQARETQRQREQQYQAQFNQAVQYVNAIEPEAQNFRAIKAARDAGDYEGVARALGHASWNDLLDDQVQRLTNPSHAKVIELERKLAEREERERRLHEQAQTHAAEAHRQQVVQAYKGHIAAEMKASNNPVFADFHGDRGFVDAVFEVREAHYKKTGNELPLNQCLDVPGAKGQTLRQALEGFEKLGDRYRAARTRTAPAATTPTKPASPSRASSGERSERRTGRSRPETRDVREEYERRSRDEDRQWAERARNQFAAAVAAERKRA